MILTCSSVPHDFETVLERYTKQGLRVIAAAHKGLDPSLQWGDVDALTRSELEEKAEFLGLIIMQNLVKNETYGAIKELHAADICTVMVTGDINYSYRTLRRNRNFRISATYLVAGDNILTAISVGRDCELVRPDQTIIRVEAEVSTDTGFYGSKKNTNLNVSYTLEDNDRSNMVYDVSLVRRNCSVEQKLKHLLFLQRNQFLFLPSPILSSRCKSGTTCSPATGRPSASSATTIGRSSSGSSSGEKSSPECCRSKRST